MAGSNLRRNKRRRISVLILGLVALILAGAIYAKVGPFADRIATGGEIIEENKGGLTDKKVDVPSIDDAPVVPNDVDPKSIKSYELVTENEMYKIRKLDDTFVITIYAIINRPDQADTYRDQLREYKGYALEYLKQQGLRPNDLKITYEPEEATNL